MLNVSDNNDVYKHCRHYAVFIPETNYHKISPQQLDLGPM